MAYGAVSLDVEGGARRAVAPTMGTRKSMALILVLAVGCIALASLIVASGDEEPAVLLGGYTAHLDLDTGTLKGLEAAAGVQAGEYTTRRSARGCFDDATPHLPAILAAQQKREASRAQTQVLAGIKGNKEEMAAEGMHTEDYESMTDAAGNFD